MRKRYSPTFKAESALEVLKEHKTLAQISSERKVHTTQLSDWKTIALNGLPSLFSNEHKAEAARKAAYEKHIEELYAEIGRLTTQVSWLKKKSGIEPDAD